MKGHGDKPLKTIKRDIAVLPENMRISDLFNYFLEKREHIALVVDEYGGMAGIVTMEDVMETLLGMEITDESDKQPTCRRLRVKNGNSVPGASA